MRTPLLRGTTLGARWPLALLIASVGLTAVAVYEAVRVASSNQAVAERTAQDYAEFAAWSYARHLEQDLGEMGREVLSPINHGAGVHVAPEIPGPSALVHFLPFDTACNCHRTRWGRPPETLLAFSVRADTLAFVVNTHPKPSEGWEIDRPLAVPTPAGTLTVLAPEDRLAIIHAIRTLARQSPDPEHGYTDVALDLTIGPRLIIYALMPTATGDTIVYAAQYAPVALTAIMQDIKTWATLLPPSLAPGDPRRQFIDIVVSTPAGHTYFSSTTTPLRRDLVGRSPLDVRYANMVVEARIDPERAGALIVGGLPASRLPFLVGVLMLAAMLTVAAVALLRREAELGRVRAEWIASVSHELRTPLAQIRLFLDTVRLGRAPTEERRDWALTQVDRETTRLSHLIEKVLSFSRLGRGVQPDAQPSDIAIETEHIVEEFRTIAETRRVRIVTTAGIVPLVPLRRDALRHILLNLLDNAVKYGPPNQTVSVRVDRVGNTVSLSVADEGPGVPVAEREVVWRAFARGKGTSDQGGSGIGLSIVREIAGQHGGRAWVQTAPSGGALFTVTIPLGPTAA